MPSPAAESDGLGRPLQAWTPRNAPAKESAWRACSVRRVPRSYGSAPSGALRRRLRDLQRPHSGTSMPSGAVHPNKAPVSLIQPRALRIALLVPYWGYGRIRAQWGS
jgi:hypothetical protein